MAALLGFWFTIIASKMKDFVPIKRSLVTTLSETPPLTSKKYVAEDTKNNPKQPELDELLFSHSSFFALEF